MSTRARGSKPAERPTGRHAGAAVAASPAPPPSPARLPLPPRRAAPMDRALQSFPLSTAACSSSSTSCSPRALTRAPTSPASDVPAGPRRVSLARSEPAHSHATAANDRLSFDVRDDDVDALREQLRFAGLRRSESRERATLCGGAAAAADRAPRSPFGVPLRARSMSRRRFMPSCPDIPELLDSGENGSSPVCAIAPASRVSLCGPPPAMMQRRVASDGAIDCAGDDTNGAVVLHREDSSRLGGTAGGLASGGSGTWDDAQLSSAQAQRDGKADAQALAAEYSAWQVRRSASLHSSLSVHVDTGR